jgi:uracil-DNA glycosylase family 4
VSSDYYRVQNYHRRCRSGWEGGNALPRRRTSGAPFVGPAGQVLDRALEAAGLHRSAVYITNAVKHFKWEPRGKRRMHKTPEQREIEACYYWLEQELARVTPVVLVALGALGTPFRHEGRWIVAT